jgi:hypothetical protein
VAAILTLSDAKRILLYAELIGLSIGDWCWKLTVHYISRELVKPSRDRDQPVFSIMLGQMPVSEILIVKLTTDYERANFFRMARAR